MTDINEIIREQRSVFDQQLVNTFLGASSALVPDEVTLTREYLLDATIDIKTTPAASGYIRVSRFRVTKTTYSDAAMARFGGVEDDPDGPNHYTVRAYGNPLTKKGAISQRESANWYYLPDDLARQLLGHVDLF